MKPLIKCLELTLHSEQIRVTRRAIPKYFIKNMSKNKLQLEGIFIQTKVDISETKL